MTQFTKSNFLLSGGFLTYSENPGITRAKFVARFKNGGSRRFKTFLIKNFTIEEYFARAEASEAPLTILATKGFISDNVRYILKITGYPENKEGYIQYMADQRAKMES